MHFLLLICNCNKVICRLLPWGIKSPHRVMQFLTPLKWEKSHNHGTFTTIRWIWQEETHLSPPCLREWPRVWPKMKMASSSKGWWKKVAASVKKSLSDWPKENPQMRRFSKGWQEKAKRTRFLNMYIFRTFLSRRWGLSSDRWQTLDTHKICVFLKSIYQRWRDQQPCQNVWSILIKIWIKN